MNRPQAKPTSHRTALLPLGALVAVFLWSGTAVQAGTIVSWRLQHSVSDSAEVAGEPVFDADGMAGSMSGAAEQPAAEHRPLPAPLPVPRLRAVLDGLCQSPGGASSPSSNSSSPHSLSLVAVAVSGFRMAMPTGSFCYLREQVLLLLQPPPGEILDPPKNCA